MLLRKEQWKNKAGAHIRASRASRNESRMLLIAVTVDGRSTALDWDPGTGALHRKNR